MRHTRVLALVAAVAVTAANAGGAFAGSQPTLRFAGQKPVSARGAHFTPNEQVRITLRAGTVKRVRTVRASASGSFMVSFGGVQETDRCGVAMSLTAIRAGGDRVGFRLPPRECPTAMTS